MNSFQWILGSDQTGVSKASRRLFAIAGVLVVALIAMARLATSSSHKLLFDNLHWTVAYSAPALLCWMEMRRALPADRPTRRWIALGCSSVALGQLVYDIQAATGFQGVGPAEVLYFLMVPCFVTGTARILLAQLPWRQVVMAYLDALGLTLALGVVTMTLFLPTAANSSLPQVITAAVFPVGFYAAISMGLVTVLTLRMAPHPGWIFFLGSLTANAVLWFIWNIDLIAKHLPPGTWLNALFSVAALAQGIGAIQWTSGPPSTDRWNRVCEIAQRIQPLFIVLLTSVAFVLSRTIPGVGQPIQWFVQGGTGLVVAIALIRQTALLSERDRLVETEKRLRASEKKIRESEERYRSLIVGAVDGIFVLDSQGTCLEINVAGAAMLGMVPEEVVGKLIGGVLDLVDAPKVGDALKLVEEGQTIEGDWRVRRKDGALRWIGVRARLLPEGTILAFCRDITDRKQAEAMLHQAEETRRAMDHRLMQAQKLEAVGTLAAGIAHDFNNILSAIRGNAELAVEDLSPGHPAMESLQEIRKAGKRATYLVQQILAFSRQQTQPQEVVRLPELIAEISAMLRSVLPANVELLSEFESGTPKVVGDPTQLHQVIVNLCTNAWQAMDGHPGQIEIHVNHATIPGSYDRFGPELEPGVYAHLTVSDTGSGIDAETADRIFEPFFTTKARGQGTGLGLAVAQNIVAGHRGAIGLESVLGEGTTFHILLPAASHSTPQSTPIEADGQAKAKAGQGERIAYVDDEEALLFLVKRSLERRGYRVTTFETAEDALRELEADPMAFDLTVTDYNMPGLSGIALARAIKAVRPDMPVILTSGYISEQVRELASEAKVDHLVYKPDSIEELCAAILQFSALSGS